MEGSDLYARLGGAKGCKALATALYARVAKHPDLKHFFPGKTQKCAIEEFSAFLVQFAGGPSSETQCRHWVALRDSHARFRIGPKEREAWLEGMFGALDTVSLDEQTRRDLRKFFERSSAYLMNTGEPAGGARPDLPADIGERWGVQLQLDETVRALRRRDTSRALELATGELSGFLAEERSIHVALLALMIADGDSRLLSYVEKQIAHCPALVHERHTCRTLLHDACAAGNGRLVKLLLAAGADPNAETHTPLYRLGNECQRGGGEIVHVLVSAGADINAACGPKRCTPLHMAARRGNAELASALLHCGADIDARDSLGVTPLGRAINCKNAEVATLLAGKGAQS